MSLLLVAITIAPAFTSGEPDPPQPSSTTSYDVNAKMKGLFIYSFTRYIKWPEHMGTGDFVIGIYGEYESLFNELNNMAQTKKAGERLCYAHTLLCEIAQDFGPCREIEDAISATSDAASTRW